MTATVICGVDHSPAAPLVVQAAAVVARGLGARLVLAYSRDGRAVPLRRAAPARDHAGRAARAAPAPVDAELLVAELAHRAYGPATAVTGFDGDLVDGLCELAGRFRAPLLVVGVHDRGLLGSLTGRVSASVIRRAGCPVMVVPDGALHEAEQPFVDGATVVCGIASVSDLHVAGAAARLASALELRLRLVHVRPAVSTAAAAPPRDAILLLRAIADEMVALHPDLKPRVDWRLCSGRPAPTLAQVGAASRAAAVVVGAPSTRSTSSTLTRAATVPVMVCPEEADPLQGSTRP